jgi:hypothetical protein
LSSLGIFYIPYLVRGTKYLRLRQLTANALKVRAKEQTSR